MNKIILTASVLSLFFIIGCQKKPTAQPNPSPQGHNPITSPKTSPDEPLSECEKAGSRLIVKKECDGSTADYCWLTDKIHCYADQIKDSQCDVEFSEEWYRETGDGMIGPNSGPRVMCDRGPADLP